MLNQGLNQPITVSQQKNQELIMVGKATMLVKEEAIAVIDKISRIVNGFPGLLVPILSQASISTEELDQVKNQLFQ